MELVTFAEAHAHQHLPGIYGAQLQNHASRSPTIWK